MDLPILDANAIDGLDDYDLTGEVEEITPNNPEDNQNQEEETTTENEPNESHEDTTDVEPGSNEEPENNENDLTLQILKLKGISDPTKIKFEDESGAIIERAWNDLSEVERLNILVDNQDPERDLDEEEILFINDLREKQITPQQYIQEIQQQAAAEALEQYQQNLVPTYEIDSLTDEELFALDLLEKVGEENITDEELQEALENAKANETLFAKQIEGLRATYKNLEDQQKYNAELERLQHAELEYQEFSDSVLSQISSFNSFANLQVELSTDDKNDIANYMLTRRENGISDFYTDMLNPETATLAAFWLLKGPEVLNEMEEQIKLAYLRGFSLGKSQLSATPATLKPNLVVVQTPKPTPQSEGIQSAFGLEDDSYLQ